MFDLFGTAKRRQIRLDDMVSQAEEDFNWSWSDSTSREVWFVKTNGGFVNVDHIVRFCEALGGVNIYTVDGGCYKYTGTIDKFCSLIENRHE